MNMLVNVLPNFGALAIVASAAFLLWPLVLVLLMFLRRRTQREMKVSLVIDNQKVLITGASDEVIEKLVGLLAYEKEKQKARDGATVGEPPTSVQNGAKNGSA